LALIVAPFADERPGRHTELFKIRNGNWATCRVSGYPRVVLRGSTGALLPYHYRDGGDQVVAGAGPAWVTLAPDADGFVAIDKAACAGPIGDTVTSVGMSLPGAGRLMVVPLKPGDSVFDFCPNDKVSQVVAVTAVVSTASAALRVPVG
jgi:hypothetical protein